MLIRNKGLCKKLMLLGTIFLLSVSIFVGCSELKSESIDNSTEEIEIGKTDAKEKEEIDNEENQSEYSDAVVIVNDYITMNKLDSYDSIYTVLVKEPYNLSDKAAKYGLDNCEANWNKHALETAIIYAIDYSYSKDKIKEVLCSVDKFKEEEAQYAIDNIEEIDWIRNAINTANELKLNNSRVSVYETLISDEYKFKDSEAKEAVDIVFSVNDK